jgi:hypothetical protein
MTINLALRLATILISLNLGTSFANEIYITSIGDNLDLEIIQDGENNAIGSSTNASTNNGDTNKLFIKQKNTGQAAASGTIEFGITGDNNNIELGQGFTGTGLVGTDTTESGAKFIELNVTGDSNNVHVGQRNGSGGTYVGHIATVDITGNSNSVDAEQTNDGLKSVDIDLSGNGHSVISRQMSEGAHTSTIDLTNGGGAYTMSVTQNSNTAQSYTLQGTCYVAQGCAVSVTQN